jgi:MerR family transcriptional regulator, light-induced transcriptional regulator
VDDGGRYVRIGELSRRVGISPELLRAWEGRYGLLDPKRSRGGYRLYSLADEQRVERMKALLDQGLAASEAAPLAQHAGTEESAAAAYPALIDQLRTALDVFDNAAAHRALDKAFAALTIETTGRDVLFPYLRDLGTRWQAGSATVAQEHFASNVIRGRLLALDRDWTRGSGPRTVLACPPGERHELGLLLFGLAMRGHGWRVTYLGADTPIDTISETVRMAPTEIVVLAAMTYAPLRRSNTAIRDLSHRVRVAIAGRGATPAIAHQCGAERLSGDPFGEADRLAGLPSM